MGELKCNVDAAIFNGNNCFSAGMCVRDDRASLFVLKRCEISVNRSPKRRKHGV